MKSVINTDNPVQSNRINRYGYILFLAFVIYLAVIGNYELAASNLGIALIFDPFDSRVSWKNRPVYQKAWLLCHLALTLAGFAFLVFR